MICMLLPSRTNLSSLIVNDGVLSTQGTVIAISRDKIIDILRKCMAKVAYMNCRSII